MRMKHQQTQKIHEHPMVQYRYAGILLGVRSLAMCLGHPNWLVVTGTWIFFFHSVGNVIIPTDEFIFFSEGLKPPTSIENDHL